MRGSLSVWQNISRTINTMIARDRYTGDPNLVRGQHFPK
jgi:hypothetical protein